VTNATALISPASAAPIEHIHCPLSESTAAEISAPHLPNAVALVVQNKRRFPYFVLWNKKFRLNFETGNTLV